MTRPPLPGSSVALLCGVLRYLNANHPEDAALNLGDLPEEQIEDATELGVDFLDLLRRLREAHAVRLEMAVPSS